MAKAEAARGECYQCSDYYLLRLLTYNYVSKVLQLQQCFPGQEELWSYYYYFIKWS